MKKKTLFGLLTPLMALSFTACGPSAPKYEYNVDMSRMRFQNQIKGTAFDPTGLRVVGTAKNCDCSIEAEFTVDGPEIIEGDTWEAVVHAEGQDFNISGQTRDKIKVACVGDSLTAGHVWQSEAYPVYLQEYLGTERFTIGNFGENGTSITGYGGSYDNPNNRYITRQVYKDSVKFNPDVIVMCLGTNDGTNWTSAKATFVEYYHVLVDSYIEQFPDAQWVLMVSPPCVTPNTYGIQNEIMRDNINPVQRAIAEEYGFEIVDLREEFEAMEGGFDSMLRPTWNGQVDKVHFSKEGAQYVASRVKEAMENFRF